jgi:hypothetical protein
MIENNDEYLRVKRLMMALVAAVRALAELPDRRDLDFVNAEWRALLSAHYQSQQSVLLEELTIYEQTRAGTTRSRALPPSAIGPRRKRDHTIRSVTQQIAIIEQAVTCSREQQRKLLTRQPLGDAATPRCAEREVEAHETVASALRAYRDEMLKATR